MKRSRLRAPCLLLCVALWAGSSQAAEPPDGPDLSTLSEEEKSALREQENGISKMENIVSAQIDKWHEGKKEEIRQFKERQEKAFTEHQRKLHCGKLKAALLKKASLTVKIAKQVAKERRQKANEKEAVDRAREILGKAGKREETSQQLLGEAKVRYDVNPKDAPYWLKAMQRNDPQWQQSENRRLRDIQQTDPNWRAKMDNDQGDGGYSWTRLTTRVDDEIGPLDLIQLDAGQVPNPAPTGEEDPKDPAMEPAPKEAPPDFQQPFSEESPDEDEAHALRRQAELQAWLLNENQALKELSVNTTQKLEEWKATQTKSLDDLHKVKSQLQFCSRNRQSMEAHLAEAIINLPVPDHEKTEYEKPLLGDMEDWLKCERCKKPTAKPEPGQKPATPIL